MPELSSRTLRRSASGRPVAPGGWRRALVGVLVGACVGGLVVVTGRPEAR